MEINYSHPEEKYFLITLNGKFWGKLYDDKRNDCGFGFMDIQDATLFVTSDPISVVLRNYAHIPRYIELMRIATVVPVTVSKNTTYKIQD